jgi:hypothetical protein
VQIKKWCKLARGVKAKKVFKQGLGVVQGCWYSYICIECDCSKQAKLWHIPSALYCTVSWVTLLTLVKNEKYIMCAAGGNRPTATSLSPGLCTRLIRIFLHIMLPQSTDTFMCSKNYMFWGIEFTLITNAYTMIQLWTLY